MTAGRDDIGARIRTHRARKGLTQAALAAQVGVSAPTIRHWERGNAVRDIYLEPLARALGVSVSELAPDHPASPQAETGPREAVLQEGLLHVLEQGMRVAADANVVAREDVARRLAALATRIWGQPAAAPADIMTQAEAASTLGVSRQAVHRLVAEGRVKGYPNPERPDRAPMVSLAEVRALIRSRPASAAAEPVAADAAPQPSHPSGEAAMLNSDTQDDDTQAGVIPVSPDPTTPPEASGEVPADPPWFADQFVIEDLETSSAAFTGQQFRDRPKWEREVLVREHREAQRTGWRRLTPERRAELLEKWRRRHP